MDELRSLFFKIYTKLKNVFIDLRFSLFYIIFAAVFISFFKTSHIFLTIFLSLIIVFYLVLSFFRTAFLKSTFLLTIIGMFISFVLGTCTEYWGTTGGYWTYYGQPADVYVPYWVPCAWSCAYKIIHHIEIVLVSHFNPSGFKKWTFIIILPSLVIPVFGEIIAINFGTWKYSWQPQFFGMPIQAALLLCLSHLCIFTLMQIMYRNLNTHDLIYNPVNI